MGDEWLILFRKYIFFQAIFRLRRMPGGPIFGIQTTAGVDSAY
jgi:hypothetical protein